MHFLTYGFVVLSKVVVAGMTGSHKPTLSHLHRIRHSSHTIRSDNPTILF